MDVEKHTGYATIRPTRQIVTKQGLTNFVGLSADTVGARNLCMHLVVIPAGKSAQPHCHSDHETAIYILKGRIETRFGQGLRESIINEPGDMLYIGPNIWHQPMNLSDTEEAVAVVARNDATEQENVIPYPGPIAIE
ncbi:MAG: cupin domain-containing protein [Chloroflexota bacterium]